MSDSTLTYKLVANQHGWKEAEINSKQHPIVSSWAVSKVGDISTHTAGATPPTDRKEFWNGGLTWITPGDLDETKGTKIIASAKTLTNEGYDWMAKKSVRPNSLIFSTRGSIGKIATNTEEVRISQSCESFFFENHNCDFLVYWFRHNVDVLKSGGAGTTFMSITKADISQVEIPLPPLQEQQRIASVLSTQEARIEDLRAWAKVERQRLIWLTDELLSGRVRVVERQGGTETVVEADKNGEAKEVLGAFELVANWEGWMEYDLNGRPTLIPSTWSVLPLSKTASIIAGQSPDGQLVSKGVPTETHIDFHQGNADFGKISTSLSGKIISRESAPRIAQKGALLLSVRAPVGAVNIASNKICFGRGLCAIEAGESSNSIYLRQSLLRSNQHLNEIATGSTFVAVTTQQVNLLQIIHPPLQEQQRIASVLSSQERQIQDIEHLISLEQKRLTWLTEELLSGRIRVEASAN